MLKKYQLRYYNFRLVAIILITVVLGVVLIASAKDSSDAIKQSIGICLGIAGMITISLIDYNWILKYYWLIYIVNIFLLILVRFFGKTAGGATRWFELNENLPGIQPSEFAKIFLILFTAKLISLHKEKFNTWKFLMILGGLLMIPIVFIVLQPDLSTTVLLCLILFTLIYCAGLSYKKIGIIIAVLIPVITFVFVDAQHEDPWVLQPYQAKRIRDFWNQEDEASAAGLYQQQYSVEAIGSGQLNGKGLNNTEAYSVKNAGYILQAQTDFIFAVIGEELGFIGGCVVLLLLALIIFECILASIRAKDFTGRLICCGMASWVTYQSFINIGVATQILPNTGLPLPFISYGLSSLIALLGGMGFVLNISLQKKTHNNG